MKIITADRSYYGKLAEIWAASVAATHSFLPEDFIPTYKPLVVRDFFPAVQLFALVDESGEIIGFSGNSDNQLEMLFVHPNYFGMGGGSLLLEHAVNEKGVTKVDVNEQNTGAVSFYLKKGFRVSSRSETDGQGNPFPILHLHI